MSLFFLIRTLAIALTVVVTVFLCLQQNYILFVLLTVISTGIFILSNRRISLLQSKAYFYLKDTNVSYKEWFYLGNYAMSYSVCVYLVSLFDTPVSKLWVLVQNLFDRIFIIFLPQFILPWVIFLYILLVIYVCNFLKNKLQGSPTAYVSTVCIIFVFLIGYLLIHGIYYLSTIPIIESAYKEYIKYVLGFLPLTWLFELFHVRTLKNKI